MELSKEMETEIKEAEAKMTKEERDQLSNDIHNMTDEELMDAVMNDNKVIEQEDNNEVGNAPSSPVNQFIKSMSKEDILQLYSISKKIKANPSYNVVPEIPDKLFKAISAEAAMLNMDHRQIAAFAREMVIEFAEEIAMCKDTQDLKKGLDQFQSDMKVLTTMPELIDLQAEGVRKQYEVDLLKNANDPENKYSEKEREKMRAVSKAFTDSYTFERQRALMEREMVTNFTGSSKTQKIIRKRFDRYCDDFDFILNKTITNPKHIKDLIGMLPAIYPNINELQCKVFISLLLIITRDVQPDDTAGTMFMYSSLYNITSLAGSSNIRSEFGDKRIKILDDFIVELDKYINTFYPTSEAEHRETPTRDKSQDAIMSEESIDETAKKIDAKLEAMEKRTIEDAINEGEVNINSIDTDFVKSKVLEEDNKEDTPNTEINAHINVKSPEPSAVRDVSPEEAINNYIYNRG